MHNALYRSVALKLMASDRKKDIYRGDRCIVYDGDGGRYRVDG